MKKYTLILLLLTQACAVSTKFTDMKISGSSQIRTDTYALYLYDMDVESETDAWCDDVCSGFEIDNDLEITVSAKPEGSNPEILIGQDDGSGQPSMTGHFYFKTDMPGTYTLTFDGESHVSDDSVIDEEDSASFSDEFNIVVIENDEEATTLQIAEVITEQTEANAFVWEGEYEDVYTSYGDAGFLTTEAYVTDPDSDVEIVFSVEQEAAGENDSSYLTMTIDGTLYRIPLYVPAIDANFESFGSVLFADGDDDGQDEIYVSVEGSIVYSTGFQYSPDSQTIYRLELP